MVGAAEGWEIPVSQAVVALLSKTMLSPSGHSMYFSSGRKAWGEFGSLLLDTLLQTMNPDPPQTPKVLTIQT